MSSSLPHRSEKSNASANGHREQSLSSNPSPQNSTANGATTVQQRNPLPTSINNTDPSSTPILTPVIERSSPYQIMDESESARFYANRREAYVVTFFSNDSSNVVLTLYNYCLYCI